MCVLVCMHMCHCPLVPLVINTRRYFAICPPLFKNKLRGELCQKVFFMQLIPRGSQGSGPHHGEVDQSRDGRQLRTHS